ncbi:hypothetical protein [Erwinia sp. 198]|uniref:hypothetical protein n=1 Tax=Erwinia sp. 198 TaxID=2022746 RepID=UPI001F3B0299|nr:hypothetical protein [Erwinia sp. 198]
MLRESVTAGKQVLDLCILTTRRARIDYAQKRSGFTHLLQEKIMKKLTVIAIAAGMFLVMSSQADAKGCLKGAAAGGVAGHVAHHGVAGAAAGCAVGHHMAKKKEKEKEANSKQGQK